MADHDDSSEGSNGRAEEGHNTRRDFLRTLGIGGLGAGLGAVIIVPAGGAIVYPLQHQTISGSDAFLPAGSIDRFKEGKPIKVDLFADKRDAWNRVVQVKIGSAWVIRQKDGTFTAFSTVCPHLGCAIDYDPDKERFKCPCHRSTFSLDGKVKGGPAPRAMDALETKTEKGQIAIQYQRFRQGIEEKEPV